MGSIPPPPLPANGKFLCTVADEVKMKEKEVEETYEDPKPIGDPIRVSRNRGERRTHYEAFEFVERKFNLEDPVLIVPENEDDLPYVAIIKDITQTNSRSMMITVQWFYRPLEATRKDGGSWYAKDCRELFYSFHRDEVPAASVMHKCVVHFLHMNKKRPYRKEHPGFIVQCVFDTLERKVYELSEKDYADALQHEIDLLVQQTISRLGELPDKTDEEEEKMEVKKSVKSEAP